MTNRWPMERVFDKILWDYYHSPEGPAKPTRRPRRSRRLTISRPYRAAIRAVEAHETRGKP